MLDSRLFCLVLPTQNKMYFTNLRKIQKAFKASYPPGEAKEDWQIINELSSAIKGNAHLIIKRIT